MSFRLSIYSLRRIKLKCEMVKYETFRKLMAVILGPQIFLTAEKRVEMGTIAEKSP